ncbi:hypothetical protein LSAT2_026339, partial [Lamellibrachia satsuma]
MLNGVRIRRLFEVLNYLSKFIPDRSPLTYQLKQAAEQRHRLFLDTMNRRVQFFHVKKSVITQTLSALTTRSGVCSDVQMSWVGAHLRTGIAYPPLEARHRIRIEGN